MVKKKKTQTEKKPAKKPAKKAKATKATAKKKTTTKTRKGVKRKPSKSKLLELIFEHSCVVDVAKAVGVHRKTVHEWIKADDDLKQAMIDSRDNLVDLAKAGLKQNIIAGREKSIIYVLGTLGRKEGFANVIQLQDRSKMEDEIDDMSDEQIVEMMEDRARRLKKANDK